MDRKNLRSWSSVIATLAAWWFFDHARAKVAHAYEQACYDLQEIGKGCERIGASGEMLAFVCVMAAIGVGALVWHYGPFGAASDKLEP